MFSLSNAEMNLNKFKVKLKSGKTYELVGKCIFITPAKIIDLEALTQKLITL